MSAVRADAARAVRANPLVAVRAAAATTDDTISLMFFTRTAPVAVLA